MKVALVQQDIVWGDRTANLKRLDLALDRTPGAELYVFPEMFTTGFASSPDSSIDTDPQGTVEWMKSHAKAGCCALAGSIAMEENGKCFNRMYFVKPDGETIFYDKRHLFSFGGEHLRFTPGNRRVVVEYGGVRFLLTVCYDIRYPVWDRNLGDYDAMIVSANWPVARHLVWQTLPVARAIENQSYVIAVNRVGRDPMCDYMGGSVLVNPFGIVTARCADDAECEAVGDINMQFVNEYNSSFPVLDGADKFEIKI
ncbi:MAG: nitrilase family protein [Bacteroidales bacterium]|nr:nitrilase family protein [Bacteroidales bacterium]